ncbi:MAG TPA: 2-dehydropantoate 2-reductase N-terminal domain-containing protein [Oscillospiraceae bacterium]|nr:2-dehydropantoate 2-reductase N-terminal domain-containing protein [Oscillospiraceae bacterium]HPS35720.1 2-dehydropantoate 2-reductase N-terminal domain-containing protein [Oscillospiraceae bacterium]
MQSTVIIGSGQTGRGFIGRLLFLSGLPFTLLDTDRELVSGLQQKGRYSVIFFSTGQTVHVSGYQAFQTDCEQAVKILEKAENIFISVGAENLEAAARYLAQSHAAPKNIILCENAADPAGKLRKALESFGADSRANLVEAAIFCTTVNAGPGSLDILSEDYSRLPYDSTCAQGALFDSAFFEPSADFSVLLKRKIYTYNAASAIIAYNGWALGYSSFAEAAGDPAVLGMLRDFYAGINRAITAEYGIEPKEQQEFADMSLKKFTNPLIADSIERNARQPRRKLGPDERIAFPLKLLTKYGFDSKVLCRTAALAVLYGERCEPEWVTQFGRGNAGQTFSALSKICDQSVAESVDAEYAICGSKINIL